MALSPLPLSSLAAMTGTVFLCYVRPPQCPALPQAQQHASCDPQAGFLSLEAFSDPTPTPIREPAGMPAAEEEALCCKGTCDIHKQVANRWQSFFMQVLDNYVLSVLCASNRAPTGSSTARKGKGCTRQGERYLEVPRKSKGTVS